ncbi:hypothetical protein BJF85_01565 [Saccharomonospora sp. CUA-673]|uniref:hypothetical protein n=1 Tax=Saccharomonospora sp. CUA-673 TaxID=1904969 RepID=UPI000959ECB5|nr:hypothetical protein [Saccharomonospora sp. CUA-673]OLT45130.1 hypothetical protein BJF85_01565 [Saccharomonospora sp. CUA-673]
MDIAIWIFVGVFCAALIVVVGIAAYATVQQRRTPMEQREQQVLDKLRQEEAPDGTTSVLSGYRSGVNDDAVRKLAENHGYTWTGYSGRNDRRLNFRRTLPGSTS